MSRRAGRKPRGFTLVEVIVALVILGVGIMALLRLFPEGVKHATSAENMSRAALLAQEIMENIKMQGAGGLIRPIPGSPELVPMPGDGLDTDSDGIDDSGNLLIDLNGNGTLDADFDGLGEVNRDNDRDDDGDNLVDDDGDGASDDFVPEHDIYFDWDFGYDPEWDVTPMQPFPDRIWVSEGVDEEFPDGKENDEHGIDLDGDGVDDLVIDEDVHLAYDLDPFTRVLKFPLRPGNGLDDDGDGRIDEEIFDGFDNDFPPDGRIDEDCRAASYPLTPRKFPDFPLELEKIQRTFQALMKSGDEDAQLEWISPDNRFAWRIIVGRVSDAGGDGIDNDGDGSSDISLPYPEELRNGIDDDGDGLIDEDCWSHPVRGYRRITVQITWDGDGDVNRDGFPGVAEEDDDSDGGIDFEDDDVRAAMILDAKQLGLWDYLDDSARSALTSNSAARNRELTSTQGAILSYLWNRWAMDDDEDGRIDEEILNNEIDDDGDRLIDEGDGYSSQYLLTSILKL